MRHLFTLDQIPRDRALVIFGAGAGGLAVYDRLHSAGYRIDGYIDDYAETAPHGLPLYRTKSLSSLLETNPVAIIASQHWRAIGRTLRACGLTDLVDGSPLLRTAVATTAPATTDLLNIVGLIPSLHKALRSSLGFPVETVLHHLSPVYRAVADAASTSIGTRPVFIEGAGQAARMARQWIEQFRGLGVAGFVADKGPAFLDWIDVCPWQALLDETDPAVAPFILCTTPVGAARLPMQRERGFEAVAWLLLEPKEYTYDQPEAGPTSLISVVVSGADPVTAKASIEEMAACANLDVVVYGLPSGSTLDLPEREGQVRVVPSSGTSGVLDAIRLCQGDIIGICPDGAVLRPNAATLAAERFAAQAFMGLLIDHPGFCSETGSGPLPDLLTKMLESFDCDCPVLFTRRSVLAEVGIFSPADDEPSDSADLFIRLAVHAEAWSAPLAVKHGTPVHAMAPPASEEEQRVHFGRRAGTLGRIATPSSLLGDSCLLRYFSWYFNKLIDAGQNPSQVFTFLPADLRKAKIDLPSQEGTEHEHFWFNTDYSKPAPQTYFMVLTSGNCGAIWYASALNLHEEIFAGCGIDHPIESCFRYNLQKDGSRLLHASTDQQFRFGASQGVMRDILSQHGITLSIPPRDYTRLPHFVFDELEDLPGAGTLTSIGSIHAFTAAEFSRHVAVNRNLLGDRKVVTVNMIRHPVPRTESFMKAFAHYQLEQYRSTIDTHINQNLAEWRQTERQYGISVEDPRVRAIIFTYRIGNSMAWVADELKQFHAMKALKLEDLQSDPTYFADSVTLLTSGRVKPDQAYLDKVYAPENLGVGRRGAIPDGSRPPGDRLQWDLWSDWERREFSVACRRHGVVEIYAAHGYDLSYV